MKKLPIKSPADYWRSRPPGVREAATLKQHLFEPPCNLSGQIGGRELTSPDGIPAWLPGRPHPPIGAATLPGWAGWRSASSLLMLPGMGIHARGKTVPDYSRIVPKSPIFASLSPYPPAFPAAVPSHAAPRSRCCPRPAPKPGDPPAAEAGWRPCPAPPCRGHGPDPNRRALFTVPAAITSAGVSPAAARAKHLVVGGQPRLVGVAGVARAIAAQEQRMPGGPQMQ